jgi:hypothetical protein
MASSGTKKLVELSDGELERLLGLVAGAEALS